MPAEMTDRRFRARDQIRRAERRLEPRAERLGPHGFNMPVSSANGAKTLVVLVVEDEFFIRYGIANALREAGYRVVECGSGEEAVALCRSNVPIDVLFTDINLGGSISGWEVAERFRIDRPDGPVLYTSGNDLDPPQPPLPRQCVCCQTVSTRRRLEHLRAATHKMTLWVIRTTLRTRSDVGCCPNSDPALFPSFRRASRSPSCRFPFSVAPASQRTSLCRVHKRPDETSCPLPLQRGHSYILDAAEVVRLISAYLPADRWTKFCGSHTVD